MRTQYLAPLAMVIFLFQGQPASAYNYNYYNYYGLGSYLFWPFQSLLYGRASGSYYAPTYAAQNLAYGVAYNPFTSRPLLQTQPYQDAEPVDDPRQRYRPYRNNWPPQDQIAYGQQGDRPNAAILPPGSTGYYPPDAPPIQASGHYYPLQAPAQPLPNAPLAEGFIAKVNSQFGGDISKALWDSSTRKWARAIGLVTTDSMFSANLTDERVTTIKAVLRDSALDSSTKLQTVKLLLGGK